MKSETTTGPRAVSVAILKGGVGKSTIAVNLTDRLAAHGNQALFIDLDPNGHASKGLDLREDYEADIDIGDVIYGDATLDDVIVQPGYGFDVIPSNDNLEFVEDQLRNDGFGITKLKKEIVDPLLGDKYDYIVTDSPAYRGMLADSALVATGNIILPLTATSESISGFEQTIQKQVADLRSEIGLEILAIVPNDYSGANRNEAELIDELNDDFSEYLPPFARRKMLKTSPGPGIRHRIAFSRAYDEGMPLSAYDPDNDQIERLDQLAASVEQGGVKND